MSERTEYCSCQSIHAAHTWGGRPVRYCPGVLRDEDSNNVCRGHGGDGLPENCRICRPPAPAAPEAPPGPDTEPAWIHNDRFGWLTKQQLAKLGIAEPPLTRDATETQALRRQLEHDRTKVAEGVTAIKRALEGREWLKEGRGPYTWNDDRWHSEFAAAYKEIAEALEPLAKIAADWSHCSTSAEEIAEARRELEAENQRLREALTGAVMAFGKINLGLLDKDTGMFVYQAELKSRAALGEKGSQ